MNGQIAEILIIGQHNPLLGLSRRQDLEIGFRCHAVQSPKHIVARDTQSTSAAAADTQNAAAELSNMAARLQSIVGQFK